MKQHLWQKTSSKNQRFKVGGKAVRKGILCEQKCFMILIYLIQWK